MTSLFCPRCIPRWGWALSAVCFLACLWIGSKQYQKPAVLLPPKPPATKILIIFHVYDTAGNEHDDAILEGPTEVTTRQRVTGSECQLSEFPGVSHTLQFRYNKKQGKQEDVVWRPAAEYRLWLDQTLPQQLQQLDPGYNKPKWQQIVQRLESRLEPIKYDYPVVFRVKP